MPLGPRNTQRFVGPLYAGQLVTVQLLKRGNDQQQGTVTSYLLFRCRRSVIHKTGETIDADAESDHSCYWHIPTEQLLRHGLKYLNAADRIVENFNTQGPAGQLTFCWQPEATTDIEEKLFRNMIKISCLRIDPSPSGN